MPWGNEREDKCALCRTFRGRPISKPRPSATVPFPTPGGPQNSTVVLCGICVRSPNPHWPNNTPAQCVRKTLIYIYISFLSTFLLFFPFFLSLSPFLYSIVLLIPHSLNALVFFSHNPRPIVNVQKRDITNRELSRGQPQHQAVCAGRSTGSDRQGRSSVRHDGQTTSSAKRDSMKRNSRNGQPEEKRGTRTAHHKIVTTMAFGRKK